MHQLLNPMSRVAPAPHMASAPHVPRQTTNDDIFGLTTSSPAGAIGATAAPVSATGATQDMIGLFGNFGISGQSSTAPFLASNHRARDPFAQAPVANGSAPMPPHQTLPSNTPFSNHSSVVPSPAPAAHAHNQFSQVPVSGTQATNFAPQYSRAPQQQAPSPQPQAHAYGNAQTQKPNGSTPPHQIISMAPQQTYYQPNSPVQYTSTKPQSGLPPQGGYPMVPPQQHQSQQYNQVRGHHQHSVQQQQYHHQQSYSPSQQQCTAQQAPQAQPKKPNLSQFDPFQ